MPELDWESLLREKLILTGDGNVVGKDNTVSCVKQTIDGNYNIQIGEIEITISLERLHRLLGTEELVSNLIEEYTRSCIECLASSRIVGKEFHIERNLEQDIKEWISESETGFALIVGEAGIGKTHLLCNLAKYYQTDGNYAVVFYRSEDFLGGQLEEEILNSIGLGRKLLNLSDVIRDLTVVEKKKVIIFLDTLDLISFNHGPTKLRKLLLTVRRFPAIVVGASRPYEYGEFKELIDKKFSLAPLHENELQELLAKLNVSECANQIIHHNKPLLDLTRNPLHLHMLVSAFRSIDHVPTNLSLHGLYEAYWVEKILNIREGTRLPAGITSRSFRIAKEELLWKIAIWMFDHRELQIDHRQLQEGLIKAEVEDKALHDLLSEGILIQQGDKVLFSHQTFWEFTAARALIDEREIGEIAEKVVYPIYRGVARQIGLHSRQLKRFDLFTQLVECLRESPLLSKIVLVDLLIDIIDPAESEIKILEGLCREDYRLLDYVLGLVIYEGGRHSFGRIFNVLQESCYADKWEIRRRISEALPCLVKIDANRTFELLRVLREDNDPTRWDTDVRRRVVEAIPSVYEFAKEITREFLFPRDDDQIYVLIAIVEVIAELQIVDGVLESEIAKWLNRSRSNEEEKRAILFLREFLQQIHQKPETAVSTARQRSNDSNRLIRICVARNLPKILTHYPEEIIELLRYFIRPEEHKHVRRPIAKGAPEVVRFMRGLPPGQLYENTSELFLMLARDQDDLIRRTLCDNALDDLIEIDTGLVKQIVVDHLLHDENSYVKLRADKLALRLINYYPNERQCLLKLVQTGG